MGEDTKPSIFANIVNLIKALAWPLLIAFILVQYNRPFSDTINLLPILIKHANKLSAGGITVEIEQQAQATGNSDLANALKGLSPGARKLLLQIGQSDWILWSKTSSRDTAQYFSSMDRQSLDELNDRNLISYREDPRDFNKFIQSLGTIAARNEDGYQSLALTTPKPLSADQEKRLLNEGVRLSPLGQKAYSVILDVVVNS